MKERLPQKILMVLLLAGLAVNLYVNLSYPADPDTSVLTVTALSYEELGPSGLTSMRYTIQDPYTLENFVAIPLIMLMGNSILAQHLVGYLEYLLLMVTIGYTLYRITSNVTGSTAAMVLLMALNINFEVVTTQPLYHVIAYATAPLLLLGLYDVEHNTTLKNIIITVSIIVLGFCDLTTLAIVLIPWSLYQLFTKKITVKRAMILGCALWGSALAYLVKMWLPDMFIGRSLALAPAAAPGMLPGLLQGLLIMLGLPALVAIVLILATARTNSPMGDRDLRKYVLTCLWLGSLVMMVGYLAIPSYGYLRFLAWPCIAVVATAGILIKPSMIPAVAVLSLFGLALLVPAAAGVYNPNPSEQQLGEYLLAHNITYGYADWKYANAITALGAGRVHVLGMGGIDNGSIDVTPYLTQQAWIQDGPAAVITSDLGNATVGTWNVRVVDQEAQSSRAIIT